MIVNKEEQKQIKEAKDRLDVLKVLRFNDHTSLLDWIRLGDLIAIIERVSEAKERRFLVQEGWNGAINHIRDQNPIDPELIEILDRMYDYS